jgi:phosphoglycerol transferase MdoB-like AlkP superfamily enzyme
MERFMGSAYFGVEQLRGPSLHACDAEAVSRVAALLEPGDRPPRFVLAFLMSTHFGYHFPKDAERFRPSAPALNALELAAEDDRQALLNRYRNSAHYVDSLIGGLLEGVASENTLVIVTGDHGESLFDDGTIAHSSLLSEVQTRVPLVIGGAGVAPGPAREAPTSHVDILPTLFARMGVEPASLALYEGRDLLERGGPAFVSLISAKARGSSQDLIALVSLRDRYAMRLDAARGELLFLGRLGRDGRPSREHVSQPDGAQAMRWLARYFDSMTDSSAAP